MTVRFFPSKRTRLPFELGFRPSPASITPALTNSSLNFPISVRICSLGITPFSEFLSALTRTMTRISLSPYLNVERGSAKSTRAEGILLAGEIDHAESHDCQLDSLCRGGVWSRQHPRFHSRVGPADPELSTARSRG